MSVPLVGDQGDGVRSFVGLLLDTMVSMPIVLIDEPEVFLHPPHARLLKTFAPSGDRIWGCPGRMAV